MSDLDIARAFAAYALADGGSVEQIRNNLRQFKARLDQGETVRGILGAVDWSQPDPDRCLSCGHPQDVDCGCLCCYDDHTEAPDG